MFALEYFYGLELLRPLLLFLLTGRTTGLRARLWITLKRWLLYALTAAAFLLWRLTHSTPRGEVTLFKNLALDPALTLATLAKTILNDIYEAAVVAWGRMFAYLDLGAFKLSLVLAYAAVVILAAAAAFLLFKLVQKKVPGEPASAQPAAPRPIPWGLQAILVGIFALLVAGWPVWVTDLRLELSVPWDRFTQPLMLGSCLVLVGLLDLLLRPHLPKLVVISLLVGLAAGAQLHYAFDYRLEWAEQKQFFWQLAWRIPSLKPGTLLLTSGLPFYISSDNSLTAALNWIYAPQLDTREMPYLLYDLSARLGNRLPALSPDIPISQEYRATEFHGSTSQALVFYYAPPRCLKVLDQAADRLYPNKPDSLVAAMPLSRLDLIQPAAPSSPQLPSFLGPEPAHDWCYYFEKIELANQMKDWPQAARLADAALQSKPELTRDDAAELTPLIVAYAQSARYDDALQLSLSARKLSAKLAYSLCDTWYALSRQIPADPEFQSTYARHQSGIELSQPFHAMRSFLRLPRFSARSAPFALLVLCLLAFVPLVYRLGFYWDDWPSIWFLHSWGPQSFKEGFALDRPLLAWVFMLTTPIFGESTAAWQFFGLFTRFLASLAWWWTLRGLWPQHPRQAFWIAALFAVYPGFAQQYISVTYSNSFLVFTIFIVSFGSMVWAYRKPGWFWPLMALSLLTSAINLFITEYFFGLEFLRPFLLWLLLPTPNSSRLKQLRTVVLRWLPYLAILLPFIIWRLFIAPSPRADILLFSQLSAAPLATIGQLFRTILQDFGEVNFLAWFSALDLRYLNDFDTSVLSLLVAAVLLTVVLSFFYLLRLSPGSPAGSGPLSKSWPFQALALGVLAFLVSGWAIWITNLHFELLFPFDRFTLITMLGTSLLIGGLLGLLDWKPWLSAILLALILALSTGVQFQQRLVFRQEWLSHKNFFWQLVWRVPGLQPGTTLMTSEIPFTYYSDNSLTAPLNWIYAPHNTSPQMSYLLYDIEARLGAGLPAIEPGLQIDMPYRAAAFEGSTSQAVVLFYDPPRCLKVMDPALDRYLPVKPLYIREATPLSRLDLILPDAQPAAVPPQNIFGPEPPHAWCYYFEKAELYAQTGEWEKVADMADHALKLTKHFTEKNVSELIPFVIGYAHSGKWEKAVQLSLEAYQIWDKTQYPLCDAWNSLRLNTTVSAAQQAAISQIQTELSCQFPGGG